MLAFLQTKFGKTWGLTAAILFAFLAVPLFSLYFWQQLSGHINQSDQLRLRTETSLGLLDKIDGLVLAESNLTSQTLKFIDSRQFKFVDTALQDGLGQASEELGRKVDQLSTVIAGLPLLSWRKDAIALQTEFGYLHADFQLVTNLAVQDSKQFVQNDVDLTVQSYDEFTELDSLAQSWYQRINRQLSQYLSQTESLNAWSQRLVLIVLDLGNQYTQLRDSRQEFYIHAQQLQSRDLQTAVRQLRDYQPIALNQANPATQGLIQSLGIMALDYESFLRERYAQRVKSWILTQGRQALALAKLTSQLEAAHGRLMLGLAKLGQHVRGVLDSDVAELSGARQQVQGGMAITGSLIMAVSLLMVALVFMVFWQLSTRNHKLAVLVAEQTSQLASANQALETQLKELRAAQDHLVDAKKMAALASLVAGVAHEINTPLGVALTAATFGQERIKELQSGDGSAQAGIIPLSQLAEANTMVVRNLERTSDLVRSFKLVAVDQTRDDIHEFVFDAYIGEVVQSLGAVFRGSGIEIRQKIDPGIKLNTYAGALSQIVTNLLLNARYHAFAKGSDGLIALEGGAQAGIAWLLVSDNGCGIAAENRGKIFEPFYTTRRQDGGTGLGLFIVKNLACNKLKGSLRLLEAGEQGRTTMGGAAFRLEFPGAIDYA